MKIFCKMWGTWLFCGMTLAALMCFGLAGCNNDPDNSRTLSSLEITALPEKNVYDLNEELDPGGLAVSAKYSDGSTETVTEYTLDTSGFDSAVEGIKTITVNYEDKQVNFCVGVYFLSSYPSFEMVLISGGDFLMGSPCNETDRRDTNEGICDSGCCTNGNHELCSDPTCTQRSVKVSSFYISKYQVTQAEYQTVMRKNPSYFHGGTGREPAADEDQGKRPVEMINWYEAIEFCNELSEREGKTPAYTIDKSTTDAYNTNAADTLKWTVTFNTGATGYRLPTEAQWEYACRAGTTTAYYNGSVMNDDQGWSELNSNRKTHQVGLKPANPWGLYDMNGNVMDWCWDWFTQGYAGVADEFDPMGAVSGDRRVGRGGHWNAGSARMRSAQRMNVHQHTRFNDTGIRLVLPAP